MKKDLLSRIEDQFSEFSKSQRKIATYIINNYDKAAYMIASKLGEEVGVSESTVVRFAHEMGFEGYPELQSALRDMIRNKLTAVQRIEIANTRMGDSDVLEKVVLSDVEKLRDTLDNISRDDFNRAVDTIVSAKMIYLLGVRSSASLVSFMNFYFRLIFPNVRLVQTTSSSEMYEELLRVGKGDAVIAISFPRYSKGIIGAVEYTKKAGADIITITDSEISPIAQYADSLLIAKSDMASFVDSLVAPLSIINALIVAIGKKKELDISDTFSRLEAIWDKNEVYDKTHD